MEPLITCTAIAAPLDQSNVDTDAILPKAFLKSIERTGYGAHLFDGLRYLDPYVEGSTAPRRENPGFVLNQAPYRQAGILLGRANFGCGSSREHAVWALLQFGIRVVVAESFSDIFQSNALRNGLLLVALAPVQVSALFEAAHRPGAGPITVDLARTCVVPQAGPPFNFAIAPSQRDALMQGLDEIGQTLARAGDIRAFEQQHRARYPWA